MKRIRQSRLQLIAISMFTTFATTTGLTMAQQPVVQGPLEFRLDGDAWKLSEAAMKSGQGLKATTQAVANAFPCESQAWNLQDRILSPGKVVDIDKDMAVVVSGSLPSGLAHIYRFNGAFWEFDLTIDSPVSHKSVSSRDAALAIDGNVFVIGLPHSDFSGDSGFFPDGVVHIYRLDNTSQTWQLEVSLTPGSPPEFANFGSTVAISGDTIFIGAPGIEKTYVYQRTETGWIEQQQLVASDGIEGDEFGTSVAISGDHAIVSAPLHSLADRADGAAYMFQFNGTQWVEQMKLTGPIPQYSGGLLNQYGASVSLEGITAVVGSPNSRFLSASLSFVYRFDGITWNLIATLNPDPDESLTALGSSTDIDGNVIVTGATCKSAQFGAIYVFEEIDGQWLRQARLLSPEIGITWTFGKSVAVSQGHILASHSSNSLFHYSTDPPPDCNGNGVPDACDIIDNPALDCNLNYVIDVCDIANGFSTDCNNDQVPDECEPDCDLNGVTDSCDILSGIATDINANGIPDACECPVQRKILPVFPKSVSRFGAHTRIDGNLAIIGAWSDNNEAGVETGAAYIYRRQGLDWTFSAKLLASDGIAYANFGNFIDISGDVAVVGVPDPTSVWCSGNNAVYVYRYHPDPDQWIEETILRSSDLSVTAGCSYGIGVDVEGDVLAVHTSFSEGDISYTAAIIYRYDAISKMWTVEASLPTSAIDKNPNGAWLPSNWIKLRGDHLIVGSANGLTGENGVIPGTAYIYRYAGGIWELESRLLSESGNPSDMFGIDVDLDGEWAVVGAPWDDRAGINHGAAHIYHFDGARWNIEQTLFPPPELNATTFGAGVALRGTTAAIFGRRIFSSSHGNRAVLFIYDYVQPLNQWVLRTTIQAFDGAGHSLGFPLTTDGESIIFSSQSDDEAGFYTGAAYVVSGIFGPDCNANSVPDACDIDFGGIPDVNNDGIPDECFAPSDYNYDGKVNVSDLLTLLSAWGNCPVSSICPADTNGDGKVNVTELLMMLAAWG